MSLDDLVNVTISADTTAPSRPGFGTILCQLSKVPAGFPGNVTTVVKALTDMTDLGFSTSDPGYVLVKKIFSQKKGRPRQVKLWKRSLPPTFATTLKVTAAVAGHVAAVDVNGTTCSYTVQGGDTADDVAAALTALITAVTGVDATASTDTITVVSSGAAGNLVQLANWTAQLSLKNTTADPGIATDLAAALVADSDWYGLQLDSNSKAEVDAAASWAESNKKLFVPFTCDSECMDSGVTDDVGSVLKGFGYVYTGLLFNGNDTFSYAGAAWMGGRFPFQPGSYTWAFKTLGGVKADDLTPSQQTALENKRINTYTTIASVDVTLKGITAGGEFLDITQFIDWLKSEIQVRVFGRMANLPKIPFTDLGVDIIVNEVKGALSAGVRVGGLDPGDGKDIAAPDASAPAVADVDTIDRANRHLPDVKFSGRLAGAIHDLDINGTLSV
jgi:hypothetical protein